MNDPTPQNGAGTAHVTPGTPTAPTTPETTPDPKDPTISPLPCHRDPEHLITEPSRPDYARMLAERGYEPAELNKLADAIDDTSRTKRNEAALAQCPQCRADGGHVWAFHHPEHELIHWAHICLACGLVSG